MSYNYDECVQSIQEHRRRAYVNASDESTTDAAAVTDTIMASPPDLESLSRSTDGFAALSAHCPMTPLLWMQYAYDTETLIEGLMMLESLPTEGGSAGQQRTQAKKCALESSTGILELALAEFPGCALLRLYYLESLADYVYQCEDMHQLSAQSGVVGMEVDDRQGTLDKLNASFEVAWRAVGRGTHVNEGAIVSEIYRLNGSFLLFRLDSLVAESKIGTAGGSTINNILQQLSALFQKWSKTPMGEGSNGEMMQDLEDLWNEACSILLSLCDGEQQKLKRKHGLEEQKAAIWANIDEERKKTSSLMNVFSSQENEIDVAMSNEGIAMPLVSLFPHQQHGNEVNSLDNDCSSHAKFLKRKDSRWNQILLNDRIRFLLGLGGVETSRAFLKSTSFLQRTYQDVAKKGVGHSPLQDHVATYKYSLISSMFERALSECPTVEQLWVSYVNFLRGEWMRLRNAKKQQVQQQEEVQQQLKDLSAALQSSSRRATKNCPYSSTLFELRMTTLGLTSESNLEPDHISAVVQDASELGFLNDNREAMLHLRLVAILVVKRRLLSVVSLGTTATENVLGKDYDQAEAMGSFSVTEYQKSANGAVQLNPAAIEEVRDLLEDIRDMYDEADTFLFKSHPTWLWGKVTFWKHRALSEAYILCPIGVALKFSHDNKMAAENEVSVDKEAIRCFEKLVKAQKPSHPDSWREYITYISLSHLHLSEDSSDSTKPQPDGIAAVASTLQKTRGLYHRAMASMKKAGQETSTVENVKLWVGKGIESAMFHRNYDTALLDICREYLEFERKAGSSESLSHALTLVQSKLANWNPPLAPSLATVIPTVDNLKESHGKRKLEADNIASVPENGSNVVTGSHDTNEEEYDNQSSKRTKVKTNLKQPKKADGVHRVYVGKMEYPAHPYTIHVSKLKKETQDIDLVTAFRPEFGAIVHAKINREKCTGHRGHHYHGESKCSGLVQFEEKMSVEQALQRDGEFEIGGKVIKIQRSHMPAVGIVPPGLHRVNPKGEGKASKRNKLRKKSKMNVEDKCFDVERDEGKRSRDQSKEERINAASSPSSLSLGALSFRPRSMKQKPKISLESNKKKG